jgi:membrane peptidoglycan carboxypeptidase
MVKLLANYGLNNFLTSLQNFGIETLSPTQENLSRLGLSAALGGGDIRMTELAQAYLVLARGGTKVLPSSILEIRDNNGKVIYSRPEIKVTKVLDRGVAFIVSHILSDNVARADAFGSNSLLVIPGKTVAVKTGTTNDKRDNWAVGYTNGVVVVSWVGNNDNTPMNPWLASGVTGAAPIWNRIMTAVLKDQPDLWPTKPETVVGRQVCSDGRMKDGDGGDCPDSRFEFLTSGTENVRTSTTTREQIWVNRDTDKQAKEGEDGAEQREKTVIKDKFSTYCLDCAP